MTNEANPAGPVAAPRERDDDLPAVTNEANGSLAAAVTNEANGAAVRRQDLLRAVLAMMATLPLLFAGVLSAIGVTQRPAGAAAGVPARAIATERPPRADGSLDPGVPGREERRVARASPVAVTERDRRGGGPSDRPRPAPRGEGWVRGWP